MTVPSVREGLSLTEAGQCGQIPLGPNSTFLPWRELLCFLTASTRRVGEGRSPRGTGEGSSTSTARDCDSLERSQEVCSGTGLWPHRGCIRGQVTVTKDNHKQTGLHPATPGSIAPAARGIENSPQASRWTGYQIEGASLQGVTVPWERECGCECWCVYE